MIRIARQTRLKPADIIKRASDFFGKGGEELEEKAYQLKTLADVRF